MGRGWNLIDSVGSTSVSSASVAQIELRMFGIHSSCFPPDLFVTSPECSRVFFQVDCVGLRPAVISFSVIWPLGMIVMRKSTVNTLETVGCAHDNMIIYHRNRINV